MIKSGSCPELAGSLARSSISGRTQSIVKCSSTQAMQAMQAMQMQAVNRMVDDVEFFSSAHVTWLSAASCKHAIDTSAVIAAPSLAANDVYDVAACLATPMEGPEQKTQNTQNTQNSQKTRAATDAFTAESDGYGPLSRWGEWVRRLRRRKMKELFFMLSSV